MAIMSKYKDKNSISTIFKFIFFHFSFLSLLYFPFSSSFTLSSFCFSEKDEFFTCSEFFTLSSFDFSSSVSSLWRNQVGLGLSLHCPSMQLVFFVWYPTCPVALATGQKPYPFSSPYIPWIRILSSTFFSQLADRILNKIPLSPSFQIRAIFNSRCWH